MLANHGTCCSVLPLKDRGVMLVLRGGYETARKWHSGKEIPKPMRENGLTVGIDVAPACRSVGIGAATDDNWRMRFGPMGRSHLSEMRGLETGSARLKQNEPLFAIGPRTMGERLT